MGGISTTISAYESLLLRGYTVDSVLVFKEDYYQNYDYFRRYFETDRGIHLGVVEAPPKQHENHHKDQRGLRKYFARLETDVMDGSERGEKAVMRRVVEDLQRRHEERIGELESMPRRAMDTVWWPFVQHGTVKEEKDVMVIDSAHGDYFNVFKESTSSLPAPTTSSDAPTAEVSPSLLHNMYDGSASWWTQCLGHAHPALTLAAARASGRYGHILFPSAVSAPSLQLAEKLVSTVGAGWADRVFYSDDGSTGMEVGLKMALRAFGKRFGVEGEARGELKVLGLKGSYHGDTIGAMDACEDGVFNKAVEWYKGRGFWLDSPVVGVENGKTVIRFSRTEEGAPGCVGESRMKEYASLGEVYDVEKRMREDDLAEHYRMGLGKVLKERLERGDGVRFGALVLEPIVMGAGGMIFVDPLYQRVLIDLVRNDRELFPDHTAISSASDSPDTEPTTGTSNWKGLPVVFDEVFVGLRRLGPVSTTSLLGTTPDIACYAKILTGGLLPMAVTLASSSIFDCFLGEEKVEALLHGHSYTAHPIGCTVALEALGIMDRLESGGSFDGAKVDWGGRLAAGNSVDVVEGEETTDESSVTTIEPIEPKVWSLWSHSFVQRISTLPTVQSTMSLGTILVIHLSSPSTGYSSTAASSILSQLRDGKPLDPLEPDSSPMGLPFHIHARPLGNVIYFMSSLNSKSSTLRSVEEALLRVLDSGTVE